MEIGIPQGRSEQEKWGGVLVVIDAEEKEYILLGMEGVFYCLQAIVGSNVLIPVVSSEGRDCYVFE